MPMAYSPRTRLAYIPKNEYGETYTDKGIDLKNWRPPTDRPEDFAFDNGELEIAVTKHGERKTVPLAIRAVLVAWDPVRQKEIWEVSHPTYVNGGVLATAGDLVFQGTIDGTFNAYSAATGKVLWSFPAQAPLVATPISYSVNGTQYVTLLTGLGMGILQGAGAGGAAEQYRLDSRSQARRVLTFRLDGKAQLPPAHYAPLPAIEDPEFKDDAGSAKAGQVTYDRHCARCHGPSVIAVIQAPDLRRSGIPLSAEAFKSVVHDGGLVPNGMPAFGELTDKQIADLRQYIRTEAEKLRKRTGTK